MHIQKLVSIQFIHKCFKGCLTQKLSAASSTWGNYYKFSIIKNNVITADKLHIARPEVKNDYKNCTQSTIQSMDESA
jgi:hypothetical protein